MTSDQYELTLPGDPTPKGRPRVYHGHAITPKRTSDAETRIFNQFRITYPNAYPLNGPVRVDAEFWMSHHGTPDLDNLLKLALDALNNVAYKDDSLITEINTVKRMPDRIVPAKRGAWRKRRAGDPYYWHGIEYEPHLHIRITRLEEWDPQ